MKIDLGVRYVPAAIPASDGTGFARHGIKHLSASSLNTWTNAPDVWVARYLHGHRGTFGPAPRRGQVVEDAVVATLQGADMIKATENCIDAFNEEFPTGDDAAKERNMIPDMVRIAVDELRQYGKPEFIGDGQDKINITARFDGWSIPIIGFLDLVFPDYGLVIDLKTTTRIPPVMSAEHQLQRAIYQSARGNQAVKFLYVSARKSAILEDGDPATVLAKAKLQIARLERFLSAVDADTALSIVPHNPNSFFWKGDENARRVLFGT